MRVGEVVVAGLVAFSVAQRAAVEAEHGFLGRYVLAARTDSGLASAPRAVDLLVGDDLELELFLASAGRARLRLPPGGRAWVMVDGEVVECGLEGDPVTRPLRAGLIAVELERPVATALRREARVAPGQVTEIDLR